MCCISDSKGISISESNPISVAIVPEIWVGPIDNALKLDSKPTDSEIVPLNTLSPAAKISNDDNEYMEDGIVPWSRFEPKNRNNKDEDPSSGIVPVK